MKNMKEINNFEFPKLSTSKIGIGIANNFIDAFSSGAKSINILYETADRTKAKHHWYMHRFIFIQTLFNHECVFKSTKNDEIIDGSIFNDLEGESIKFISKNPRDRSEEIAVKISNDIVNNFIQGESFVNKNYNEAEGLDKYNLRKQDHTGWLRQYYLLVDMMFEKGFIIWLPAKQEH